MMQEDIQSVVPDEPAVQYAVEMTAIYKSWPGVVACDHVNLRVRKGEIHALMGENGAGKSTLMNILYGMVRPDNGQILINGQPAQIKGPRDAIRLGIGMVHQHFMLIPPLTVAENIVLGHEPGGLASMYQLEQARREIRALSKLYGLPIDPDEKIEKLSVGQQQRVEILKMLYRGANILIMDEPTGVLTPQETDDLFLVLRDLVRQGKTVIFITHKLREVLSITDTITVLRRGKNVGELVTRHTNQFEIARMMVGRDVLLRVNKSPALPGPVVLQVQNVSASSDRGLKALHDINLEIHAGEILGIAGVEGNGQTELVEVVTGMRKPDNGHIWLHPVSDQAQSQIDLAHRNAREVKKLGVAHIPEDRRGSGLVVEESIEKNAILGRQRWSQFSWRGIVLYLQRVVEWANRLIHDFDVRTPSASRPIRTLSGGNQQKVIVARELAVDPTFLVAAQPTRGVDIGAIEFIHRQLIAQRDGQKAILLVSAELDEIRSLSDRIAVLYEGRVVSIVSPDVSEEELGVLMAGGQHVSP